MNHYNHQIKVWDFSVRLFHWSLVLLMGFLWYSGENGGAAMDWHPFAGYCVLGLILYRVLWGFLGSRYARFSDFITNPKDTILYTKAFIKGNEKHYLSHNPLGGWMVVLLLTLLFIQATSGLFTTDDIFLEGPLFTLVDEGIAYTLTTVHKTGFNFLLAAVSLHILAVLYHVIFKKEAIVKSMIHGKKESPDNEQPTNASFVKVIILALISAGIVYGVVNLPQIV